MYPPLLRLPVPPLGAVPTCGVPMPQTYLCPFSSWSLQDALTANGSRPVTDRHPLPCYIVAPPIQPLQSPDTLLPVSFPGNCYLLHQPRDREAERDFIWPRAFLSNPFLCLDPSTSDCFS